MIGDRNPYPGPRSFRAGETLYGRDREARELVDLLIAERIVLLYSASGAGKSSLIQAAVVAQMEAEDYQVLPICRPGADLGARALERSNNPFAACVIASCEDGKPAGELPLGEVPGITIASYLAQRGWIRGDPRLKLLILDQFEEVLTSEQAEEAKIGFFQQLGDALRDNRVWALLAMREEYSAALDSYRHLLPTRLSTRFRLELLGFNGAREAIRNPAQAVEVLFEDDAVNGLIRELATVRERTSDGRVLSRQVAVVEPLYLQIVCRQLWAKLPAGTQRITACHLGLDEGPDGPEVAAAAEGGEVGQALEDYYGKAVGEVAADTQVHERRVREWLERELIAPQGLRRQVPRGERDTAGISNQVVEALARHLLLRSDSRSGTLWYEIAHDRLVGMIRAGNAKWFEQNLAAFQIAATQWDVLRRAGAAEAAGHKLLKGADLDAARDWRSQHPNEPPSALDDEFLNASGLASRHERSSRRWRNAGISLVILLVAILGGTLLQHTRDVERRIAAVLTQALLSDASSEKWRGNAPELATLLAIQAYNFSAQDKSPSIPDRKTNAKRTEEILRSALQSQPFSYGVSLADTADRAEGKGQETILLSRYDDLIAVCTGECTGKRTIDLRWGHAPAKTLRTITTESDIVKAGFDDPTGSDTLVVLTQSRLEIHPEVEVIDGSARPRFVRLNKAPLGPFCLFGDGKRGAIAVEDGGVEIWTQQSDRTEWLTAAKPGDRVGAPPGPVTALACDDSGTRLAWGNRAGDVGILAFVKGEWTVGWASANKFSDWPDPLRSTLEARKKDIDFDVVALRFLPKHPWLLAVYHQGPPRIYDFDAGFPVPVGAYLMPNGQSRVALEIAQDLGRATRHAVDMASFGSADVDVDPDANRLRVVVGGERALVGLWDLATVSLVPDKLQQPARLQCIREGPRTLYADYQEVPGLGAATLAVRFTTPRPRSGTSNGKDKQGESWLAASDARADIRWWAMSGLQGFGYWSHKTWQEEPGVIYALAFLSRLEGVEKDFGLAFGGTLDSGVLRIAEDGLLPLQQPFELPRKVRALATDAGERLLVIATGEQPRTAWPSKQYSWLLDLTDNKGRRARPLPEQHKDGAWVALANKRGTFLLTAGWDGRVVFWERDQNGAWQPNTTLDAVLPRPEGKQSALLSAALEPKTERERDLVLGTLGGEVMRLRRGDDGRFVMERPLLKGKVPVRALAYSPDGRHLVAGDDGGLLWRWEINAGQYKPEPPLHAHQGAIYSTAFGSDGRLVTAGSDGLVYLWAKDEDMNRGLDLKRRLRLQGAKSEVLSARLAPSGDLVAASDADGMIHLWQLGLPKLVDRACAAMVRNLSWKEWQRYVGNTDYECTCPGLGPGAGVPDDKRAKKGQCTL